METLLNGLSIVALFALGGIVLFAVLGAFVVVGTAAMDQPRDSGRR